MERLRLYMRFKKSKMNPSFDPRAMLDTASLARKVAKFGRGEPIFTQGDPADSVMYVQMGGVKFSVVNRLRREAVVAIFGPGDFFGEGCMSARPLRMGTATAIAATTILVIDKDEMLRVLRTEPAFSNQFIGYLLARNIRVEEDLIDQLCSSSEQRLARTLLLLAGFGKKEQPTGVLPNDSQGTLAKMIGTTRPRVNFFMNKFRRRGFIEYQGYNGKITVNKSLLKVVLQE
jgi:CRP/FNR family cyclic AMP-dependent transcriptional regulator